MRPSLCSLDHIKLSCIKPICDLVFMILSKLSKHIDHNKTTKIPILIICNLIGHKVFKMAWLHSSQNNTINILNTPQKESPHLGFLGISLHFKD